MYFTTSDVSAALYAARIIERPYYWVPYGYDAQGRITYTEVWKKRVCGRVLPQKGYLYCCEADDKALLRFPTHQSLRLSQKAMPVSRADTIEDLGDWFLRREQEGRFVIQRYETLTPAALSLWHGLVLEELKESFSGGEVENAYTRLCRTNSRRSGSGFQTEMQ